MGCCINNDCQIVGVFLCENQLCEFSKEFGPGITSKAEVVLANEVFLRHEDIF